MNCIKVFLVGVLFLCFQLTAAVNSPEVALKNKMFVAETRELFDQLKDIKNIVSDPDKLENAASVLHKIADEADKLIDSSKSKDKKQKAKNKQQRLDIYKSLGKQLRNIVQNLRSSVDDITVKTIPVAAKILDLANQVGTAFEENNKTLKVVDLKIGKFIETVNKILGNNLESLVNNKSLNSWKPSLLDLEYLFWFEQCILPLVPEPITINVGSTHVEYERLGLIQDFKDIIERSEFQSEQKCVADLQTKIKTLQIYNKNPEGPFSNIIFNGGKLSGKNIDGLLKSLCKQERQVLEEKKKRDEEAIYGPAIDVNWWFSRETWNAVLTIMQLSATAINVAQTIQRDSQKIREAHEQYTEYARAEQKKAAQLVKQVQASLQKCPISPEQKGNLESNVKEFLASPDTTSARHLLYKAASLAKSGDVSQSIESAVEGVCPADTFASLKESVQHINNLPIDKKQKDYLVAFVSAVDNPKLYEDTNPKTNTTKSFLPPGALIVGDGQFQDKVMDVMKETCDNLDCHIIEIDGAKLKTSADVQLVFQHARETRSADNQKQFLVFRDMESFATVNRDADPLDPRVEVVNQMLAETTKSGGANKGLTWIATSKTPGLDSALTRAGRFNIALTDKSLTGAVKTSILDRDIEAQDKASALEEAENDVKIASIVDDLKNPQKPPHVSVMLLKGPPGNGKGFTSEKLATDSACSYVEVDPATIFSAEAVDSKFQKIRADIEKSDKKCFVVLLDEFDARAAFNRDDPRCQRADVLQGRVAVTDSIISKIQDLERKPPVNKDGVAVSGVFIVATNNPNNLDKKFVQLVDPALDIHLPYPSAGLREVILKGYLKKVKYNFTDEQWRTIIKKTSGCNSATLNSIVGDARSLRKSQNQKAEDLTFEVFEEAIDAILEKNALIQPVQATGDEKITKQEPNATAQKSLIEPPITSAAGTEIGENTDVAGIGLVESLQKLRQKVHSLKSDVQNLLQNLAGIVEKLQKSQGVSV
ncbi:MAG: hypothetical protein US49_C0006G0062 [candidate division TM6 bacterium GW2011_GWF2_37_49]|nr:MAG: hypothetical protein US49_C0006G0062 [candidate division TM6 bacterium GW2011_GWF2_37_49]